MVSSGQKTERFSIQRTFTEAYRLGPGYDDWRRDPGETFQAEPLSITAGGQLLPRRVPYPDFAKRSPVRLISSGGGRTVLTPRDIWRSRARTAGFPEEELEVDSSLLAQKVVPIPAPRVDKLLSGSVNLPVPKSSYTILDFGTNLTGFLGLRVSTPEPARLHLTFDEILSNDDVNFRRLGAVSVVILELAAGTYDFETIEPYTMRYLKLATIEGAVRIEDLYLREYVNSNVWRAHFAASDTRLNRLFAAGRETFRQNAVDIFMDCPQRERAGWLCDSYFTARVAPDLGGDTLVEKNFLENFLLPAKFPVLPQCVLPMCYPADHYDGVYIPNWAMWFVVELEEYLARSNDRATVDGLRPKVLRLLEFLKKYENSDGLLEKLPSWVFIEWSAAEAETEVDGSRTEPQTLHAVWSPGCSGVFPVRTRFVGGAMARGQSRRVVSEDPDHCARSGVDRAGDRRAPAGGGPPSCN